MVKNSGDITTRRKNCDNDEGGRKKRKEKGETRKGMKEQIKTKK